MKKIIRIIIYILTFPVTIPSFILYINFMVFATTLDWAFGTYDRFTYGDSWIGIFHHNTDNWFKKKRS